MSDLDSTKNSHQIKQKLQHPLTKFCQLSGVGGADLWDGEDSKEHCSKPQGKQRNQTLILFSLLRDKTNALLLSSMSNLTQFGKTPDCDGASTPCHHKQQHCQLPQQYD